MIFDPREGRRYAKAWRAIRSALLDPDGSPLGKNDMAKLGRIAGDIQSVSARNLIRDLIKNGWIEKDTRGYKLTKKGRLAS